MVKEVAKVNFNSHPAPVTQPTMSEGGCLAWSIVTASFLLHFLQADMYTMFDDVQKRLLSYYDSAMIPKPKQ